MKRNTLYTLLMMSLLLFSCEQIDCIFDPDGCEENMEEKEVTQLGKIGCYAASYGVASTWGSIGTSLGDQSYDQKMNDEVFLQRQFFSGVPARVFILNEGSPQNKNAYATPDGYILFGYYMFYYTVSAYNELAVAGILAHEWGHRAQFVFGWPTQNPQMELEADAFSGYYMGLAKQWSWSQIRGYFANTYATGDYNFNHPQHHGTPDQRLAAAYLGVNTARNARENNQPFSYQELHSIFSQQINSRIASFSSSKIEINHFNEKTRKLLDYLTKINLEDITDGKSNGDEITFSDTSRAINLVELFPY